MVDAIESIGEDGDGRFSRFTLINWWDQKRLRRARVLIVGAGALGNELVKNVSLVGVGNVLIADMDAVENSNLSRSILYRQWDNGRPKCEVACERAKEIYPSIRAQAFLGNIVHGLGWGAYLWADVVLAGLDNREARVAINAGSAFARKPWIDGAIEVLDGIARVFQPHTGTCYECTMSDVDWKIIESRRSCALLTREEMAAGHVPTTPTTASVIAAIQVQEAIKILHGMPALESSGIRYAGLSCEFTRVEYPRKPDCFGHDTYGRLRYTGLSAADTTVGELRDLTRSELGSGTTISLSRDIICALNCPTCGERLERYGALGTIAERDAVCARCGVLCSPETLLTLGLDDRLDDKTLHELGVPLFDVLTARGPDGSASYVLDGDAREVLGDAAGEDWHERLDA